MATLTIRNLGEHTKTQLRTLAACHGRSMEEEARTILRAAIESSQPDAQIQGLGSRNQAKFTKLGGVELDVPESTSVPTSAVFIQP